MLASLLETYIGHSVKQTLKKVPFFLYSIKSYHLVIEMDLRDHDQAEIYNANQEQINFVKYSIYVIRSGRIKL